ncbi:cyclic nucleotide-binding domain-containing protein, partial [Mycobacterium tuberculosis]
MEGALRMSATVGPAREVLIDMAGPGAVFGQTRRFGGGPRLVTASAARPSMVLVVSDHALTRVADAFPDLWRQVA